MSERRKITVWLGAALLGLATVASAAPQVNVAPSTLECHEGEYVIDAGPSRARQRLGVEELGAANLTPVEVVDQSDQVLLVELGAAAAERGDSVSKVVPFDRRRDACTRLDSRRREKLRGQRATGTFSFPRRVSCSCNSVLQVLATANDPHYPGQWGLNHPNNFDVDAPEAWDITRGASSVVIAVIDTGIDTDHPDLLANMWNNPAEVPGNGVDDDGNGYIDDVNGVNTITGSGNPDDDHGHGTHVAGTIGAVSNNGQGVAGVAWNVRLMGVKFLGANGSGSLYDAIESVDYVTNQRLRGVNVVASNNSWGGGGYMQPLYDAIARAQAAGVMFVAAAGNASTNIDLSAAYPASYALDTVISVAAIDVNGGLAGFSNYGVSRVDLAAPGVAINNTWRGGGYNSISGTSMATPHVTGALALLAAVQPGLSIQQRRANLLAAVKPVASLTGKVATGGTISARLLLSVGEPGGPTPIPTPTPAPTAAPTPAPTSTPAPTPTATPTPGYFTLSGKVEKSSGGAVSGASVTLTAGGTSVIRTADTDGNYSFGSLLGPQTYSYSVSAAGLSTTNGSIYIGSNKLQNFYLNTAGISLEAKVLDDQGTPLSGVIVRHGSAQRTTDSSGRVSFPVVHGEVYSLTATKSGYIFDNSISGKIAGNVMRLFVGQRP